jgi:NAD(P)-dependent dehydrogenase (short-subunit alcohol dehydrogenase family)
MQAGRALVIGASGGIGAAMAAALAARGDQVTGLSRRDDGLDVTDEASIARVMGVLEGPFQTVVVATGALVIDGARPEKTLKAVDAGRMAAQFALNAMGPMLVLKHALRLMPKDAPSRFAVLSARVGSIGDNALGGWYSYRTAKAALNQLIHTAAIEVARSHRQAVLALLHPGTVDTAFTAAYQPAYDKLTPAQAAAALLGVLDQLIPAQSGGFFDWQGDVIPW